jgi:hypothetical protein
MAYEDFTLTLLRKAVNEEHPTLSLSNTQKRATQRP